MPVKKKIQYEDLEDVDLQPHVVSMTREEVIPSVTPLVKPAQAIPPEKENPYYIKTLWHGIKEVWQCSKCGVFREQQDAMILHVIIHVPHAGQNALLDELMKEYKK